MSRPNFFIIGAPKCGTTALSEYLRDHEAVYITRPKEPHFFAADFETHRYSKSLPDYLSLFEEVQKQHIAVGEASVWYLYSSVAVPNICKFNPDAKLIVMLRNPVNMAYSLHSQMLFSMYEDEEDFATAWFLQAARLQGKPVPKSCLEPAFLQYKPACLLGEQVERLLNNYDKEQVKFILFDDFVRETERVYGEVLEFLGVPNDGRTEFLPINQNAAPRTKLINRLVIATPFWMRGGIEAGRRIRAFLRLEWFKPFQILRSLNTKQVKRPLLSTEMQYMLAKEFEDDVQKLALLIGRDLSGWSIDSV